MKKTLITSLMLLLLIAQHSLGTNLLRNGSFERGTEFWTNSVTDKATAKFILDPTVAKDGVTSLRVNVTKTNYAKPLAVSLTNSVVLPETDSIYLLRFRAKSYLIGISKNDNMDMNVSIICEDTTYQVHYAIRNGWVLYHLPFKTHSKNIQVRVSFPLIGTFYLDGFELISEKNDVGIDVRSTYTWNNKRKESWGWIAGDNDISLKLPDGRKVWFFNDSFYGPDSPAENVMTGGVFLRNAMVVQDKDENLTSRWYGPKDKATIYFPVVDTILTYNTTTKKYDLYNFYWIGDSFLDKKENKIKVFLIEILNNPLGAVATGRNYLAELSYPGLELLDIKRRPNGISGYETFIIENDTIYMYKGESIMYASWTHIARTPLSNMMGDKQPIEYFNGKTWTTDSTKTQRINTISPDAVVKFAEGNYAQVSNSMVMADVMMSFAQHPEGPWTTPVSLYKIPQDSLYTHYMPNLHDTLADGKYSICYSVNGGESWAKSFRDKYFYRQRYIQADFKALSPFTRKDCAGVINGSAIIDNCQECVGGTTGKTACVTGPAVFYPDCNFGGKPVALKPGFYLQKTLLTAGINDNDLASVKVMDGYRVELYSENTYTGENLNLTSDSSCLDDAGFTDKVTSIIVSRTGTDTISGWFKLRNAQNGLYLDSEDGLPFKENIIQNTVSETPSQVFHIADPLNGFYHLTAYDNRSIQTGPSADGSFVELKKTTASSDYQQFAFQMVGKDSVKLYNRKIDKVLEGVAGKNPASFVRIWTDEDQLAAVWILEPAAATALEENQVSDQIGVCPNPVKNTLYLTGIADDCSINLINLQGQVVLSQKRYNKNGVDISFLPKGVYMLHVTKGEQVKTLKALIN